jgi:hypothetical protein
LLVINPQSQDGTITNPYTILTTLPRKISNDMSDLFMM